jgi:predicted RNA binding protein YcfA (HicA-like mRNA interferase family)
MPISGKDARRILEKNGFVFVRQRGSHVAMINTLGAHKVTAIIPMHKELKKGTIRSIAKQAGLEPKEFGL